MNNILGSFRPSLGQMVTAKSTRPTGADAVIDGNSGRNILRVDNVFNMDFSLFKKIPIAESRELQLRFEAFNVFNNMDLGNPRTRVDQPNSGRITSISHSPRQMQFGLRFVF